MSFVRSVRLHPGAYVLGLCIPTLHVGVALAQATNAGATTGGAAAAPAPGGAASVGGQTAPQTSITYFPGGVAPTAPGQTLGGGNAEFSSSKPITGNERDSFDFQRGGDGTVVRGGENSSFLIGGGEVRGGTNPNQHVVRKGDTLWAICDSYFQNPYQWPRIWSYNPQIQNPHWIYPGDQIRLRPGDNAVVTQTLTGTPDASAGHIIDRRRQVPADTIFLRSEAYIEDDNANWGEVSGSREDKMFLGDYDEVYLRVSSNHELKVGQELTIYRPIRDAGKGKLVAIQGTAKVDQWNGKDHIARARIVESLDVIERGASVGPLTRRYEVVPPQRNEAEVAAKVLASVVPHEVYGQNQVVFLDKGEDAGLKPGNRLFIARRGDAWHQSLTTRSSARRIALESSSPAAIEPVPSPRDASKLPEEVLAELRIINVRRNSAMAIVTASRREIEVGDEAVAHKGY